MNAKPLQADLPALHSKFSSSLPCASCSGFIQAEEYLFEVEALIRQVCVMRLTGMDLGLLRLKRQSY